MRPCQKWYIWKRYRGYIQCDIVIESNRRLGDYLKELQLSEGRATGILTIQDELRKNGSEPARIETDEGRTYFLIEIPCRDGFEN